MNICVFCGSNPSIGEPYITAAQEVGTAIGRRGHALVFGGFEQGLMGAVARAAHAAGARVVGVVPASIQRSCVFACDELVRVDDLAERKAVMINRSDAFISLAGSYGTLDEAYEVLALQKIAPEDGRKKSAFLNTEGFYDGLSALHDRMYAEGFMSAADREAAFFSANVAAVFDYLEALRD